MTRLNPIAVAQWDAWSPGRESRAAWSAWAGAPATGQDGPPPSAPAALRRRVTPLGQKTLASALACGTAANGHYVFASRHGEYDRTVSIFEALASGEQPSPAEFSMSVHHSLAGLLSVHAGNRGVHTAVAAGADSFGFGFLEAVSLVSERPADPVLFVYYDEPLPSPYERFREGGETLPLVLALELRKPSEDDRAITFTATPAENKTPSPSAAEDFLHFYLSGAPQAASDGQRMHWRWRRDA